MYFLITTALAGVSGFVWGWTHHTWHMPYWLIFAFSIVPTLIADVVDRAVKQRRRRRQRPRRRAHARTAPAIRKNGVPL